MIHVLWPRVCWTSSLLELFFCLNLSRIKSRSTLNKLLIQMLTASVYLRLTFSKWSLETDLIKMYLITLLRISLAKAGNTEKLWAPFTRVTFRREVQIRCYRFGVTGSNLNLGWRFSVSPGDSLYHHQRRTWNNRPRFMNLHNVRSS